MIKNWEAKVWMWEIKKSIYLCGHREARQENYAVKSVRDHESSSWMAIILNHYENFLMLLEIGITADKSGDLSVSLGKWF